MMKLITIQNYLLLIDEEAEIKRGDYLLEKESIINIFPDYLTDLDECMKIIAYYPLNSGAKELDLPLLPNPFEEVDIYVKKERYEKELLKKCWGKDVAYSMSEGYLDALEETQSKQFTLEDIKKAIEMAQEEYYNEGGYQGLEYEPEQIIQSLYTQQLPKEFIPEYENVDTYELVDMDGNYNGEKIRQLKTVANSMGKEELVGTYK